MRIIITIFYYKWYILINIYVITIWVKSKIIKFNVETRFLVGYKVILYRIRYSKTTIKNVLIRLMLLLNFYLLYVTFLRYFYTLLNGLEQCTLFY